MKVSMVWPFRSESITRPRADRGTSRANDSVTPGGLTTGRASRVQNSDIDPEPLDLKLFNQRYKDIQILRKIATGTLTSDDKNQLSGVLAPLAESLTREPLLKEVKRWNEVFGDVFVGLDSFKLQLERGIPFAPSDFDLSEDSARIAIDALTRRLLRAKVAA